MSENPNPPEQKLITTEESSKKENEDVKIQVPIEIKSEESKISAEVKSSTPEPVKEWSVFELPPDSGFEKIDIDIIKKIQTNSGEIKPIIYELFEKILGICQNKFNFMKEKPSFEQYLAFYQEVNRLIPTLKVKIQREDCYSSVFYIGDTHGSIEDTFLLVDFFWKLIQKDPLVKFIFVGDYVDRNPWDLENLTLITAFHLLCPNNVILLRGNHEDRSINEHYGFIDNLLRWYHENGEPLYNEIIKYFTHLPIINIVQMYNKEKQVAARVLATHGGIPIDWQNFLEPLILEKIEDQLHCDRERSEEMGPLCNSILWSDPDEMTQNIVTDGDTGRLKFGLSVFQRFMQANNLHMLVRGHQKWNEGYRAFFGNTLYSLFSTSKYDDKKKFEPKILQLALGKNVNIIDIKADRLESEFKSY